MFIFLDVCPYMCVSTRTLNILYCSDIVLNYQNFINKPAHVAHV